MYFENYPPKQSSDVKLTEGEAQTVRRAADGGAGKVSRSAGELVGYLICHEIAASMEQPTLESVQDILKDIVPIKRKYYHPSNVTNEQRVLAVGFDRAAKGLFGQAPEEFEFEYHSRS